MTILLSLYVLFVLALTTAEYRWDRRAQYLLKPACALGFILIALMSGALETLYGQIILAALVACAIGDLFLLSRKKQSLFIFGMIAFMVSHLLYCAAFMSLGIELGTGLKRLAIFSLVPVVVFAGYHIYKQIDSLLLSQFVQAYSAIIGFMVIISVMTGEYILILGAVLFAVSDIFVGRDRFIGRKPWHALAITPLYFGAQALFALSTANAL